MVRAGPNPAGAADVGPLSAPVDTSEISDALTTGRRKRLPQERVREAARGDWTSEKWREIKAFRVLGASNWLLS